MSATAHPARPPAAKGGYWACVYPERPYTPKVAFRPSCRACWLAAKAAALQGFGDVRRPRALGEPKCTLNEFVADAAEKYGHDRPERVA